MEVKQTQVIKINGKNYSLSAYGTEKVQQLLQSLAANQNKIQQLNAQVGEAEIMGVGLETLLEREFAEIDSQKEKEDKVKE